MVSDPDQHRLREAEHQAISERDIKPDLFAGLTPTVEPVAVIFGGSLALARVLSSRRS